MVAEAETIRAAVTDLVRRRLPKLVESVTVDPAESMDGDPYLLVTIGLAKSNVADETLVKLIEDIETEVAGLDDRYPSVRFPDAA